MLRTTIVLLFLALLMPGQLLALDSDRSRTVRIFLKNGSPEQAVTTAQKILRDAQVSRSERSELLNLIAEAEIMRATYQHFTNITPAIAAIDTSLREFPDSSKAAELRWKKAWLFWKKGDRKQAVVAAREIISKDQQPANLRRAWMLMAHIHIALEQYAYARSDLLQYGLQVNRNTREQAIGMAWMAVVDRGEARAKVALKSLKAVHEKWPEVIEEDAKLFSTLLQLLHADRDPTTKVLSERFIKRYINDDEAAIVRLIHADLVAESGNLKQAGKEYAILSNNQAETTIGRKAFIRKLMIDFANEQSREKLLPAMVSLKEVADSNQLSVVEDEAMLALATLWSRIEKSELEEKKSNTQRRTDSPALHAYARAATSIDPNIAAHARQQGSTWLKASLDALLKQEKWLKAVTIWRNYPQLRPPMRRSQELHLNIAHAMRMLMLFDSSEKMLDELYNSNKANIRGQRVMVELAKLWLDRQDSDGVEKVMRWLNRNEFTIYRPEILVVVARMQLISGAAEAARQTLTTVRASDLALESRAIYWRTRAEAAESLSRWHSAANAWENYRGSRDANSKLGLQSQAKSLFTAREYAEAHKLYMSFPANDRDSAWEYHVGVCELNAGMTQQGMNRLQQLAGAGNDTFAALAKLAIADHQAKRLLKEKL